MRSARTLLTGAALAATVLLAGPAAQADDGSEAARPELTWEQKQAKAASPEGQKAWAEKQASAAAEGGEAAAQPKPTGGVHAGGGGTALTAGGSVAGQVAGSILLGGGLAAGAVALRRRSAGAGAR
ncbi:hypothetical protein OG871_18740 [Kitasatospora sp. NBC_00374]|uniref:hypothetical protein n=1 Tax=Kitasatospora sp. NBC_00374 TaxID=2975964 RepID=UPI0030E56CEC